LSWEDLVVHAAEVEDADIVMGLGIMAVLLEQENVEHARFQVHVPGAVVKELFE